MAVEVVFDCKSMFDRGAVLTMRLYNLDKSKGLEHLVRKELQKQYPDAWKIVVDIDTASPGGLNVVIVDASDIGFPDMRVLDAIQKWLDQNQPEPPPGKIPVRRQVLSRTEGWPVPTLHKMRHTECPTCHGDVFKRAD